MASIDHEAEFAAYAAAKLPRLRRVAFLLCQDWRRADDLTQTTLTRLYVSWWRAEYTENCDAYVSAILVNAFLSEQRTAWWKRATVRLETAEPDPRYPAAGDADPAELLDLRAALSTLPPPRRAAVVLRYYCGCSIEQTAHLLGCTADTVNRQTSKALVQLQSALIPPDGAAGKAYSADPATRDSTAWPGRPSFPLVPNSVPGRAL